MLGSFVESLCCLQVQHGGIAAAGRLPKRALLLCYPPPGDSMAANALKKYR